MEIRFGRNNHLWKKKSAWVSLPKTSSGLPGRTIGWEPWRWRARKSRVGGELDRDLGRNQCIFGSVRRISRSRTMLAGDIQNGFYATRR
jgi:hypothetical protein